MQNQNTNGQKKKKKKKKKACLCQKPCLCGTQMRVRVRGENRAHDGVSTTQVHTPNTQHGLSQPCMQALHTHTARERRCAQGFRSGAWKWHFEPRQTASSPRCRGLPATCKGQQSVTTKETVKAVVCEDETKTKQDGKGKSTRKQIRSCVPWFRESPLQHRLASQLGI